MASVRPTFCRKALAFSCPCQLGRQDGVAGDAIHAAVAQFGGQGFLRPSRIDSSGLITNTATFRGHIELAEVGILPRGDETGRPAQASEVSKRTVPAISRNDSWVGLLQTDCRLMLPRGRGFPRDPKPVRSRHRRRSIVPEGGGKVRPGWCQRADRSGFGRPPSTAGSRGPGTPGFGDELLRGSAGSRARPLR